MRFVNDAEESPKSSSTLWLVAAVCFGPLTLVLLLGVLMLPLWFAMLTDLLMQPEHYAHDPGATVQNVARPIAYVLCGLVGLTGLVRVLTLSRGTRPRSHRYFTIGMIATGLAALLVFDVGRIVRAIAEFPDGILDAATLVYVVLPLTGAVCLLAMTWRQLIAPRA
jgi:hypothetical protein